MKVKIHYNGSYEDEIILAGTPDEIRTQAFKEADSRGWECNNCWSEVLDREE